jgi:SpoIID/LytB domain protein
MRPPRALPGRLPSRHAAVALSCAVLTAVAASAAAAVGNAHGPATPSLVLAAGTQTVRLAGTGTVTVHWRGNGHGHGLSQYGAHGAAMKGLSTAQILSFYYPGTRLVTVSPSTIRVRLTNTSSDYTTVLANATGLTLSGFGALPATGYTQFRLLPAGSGLTLQGRTKAGVWKALKKGLGARADFSSKQGWVQSLNYDGSSIRYRGTVGAVRSGAGEDTVNRLSLDQYVEGSVPREMPTSWEPAAVHAQAIAVRSYAESTRSWAGPGSNYDICDTTSCQAYGGMAGYSSSGSLLWTDDPDVLTGNANTVLRYNGAPVFAQYAASNGGATTDGGQPYLIARADPYDSTASGDPYLDQTEKVAVSTLARGYNLKSVSSVQVTKRDGNGPWGGRIVNAYVNGTTPSGGSAHIATTGYDLGSALGIYTDYLLLDSSLTAPSAPTSVRASASNSGARITWNPPAATGGSAVTGYQLSYGGRVISLPAGARSAYVGAISNTASTTVSVRARNGLGLGSAAAVRAVGASAPARVVPVAPRRLFSTRLRTTLVDPSHPFVFALPRTVPAAATSVLLSVSVDHPTASGTLTVAPSGVHAPALASIGYRAGHPATATVTVPLTPSRTLVFTPSAGRTQVAAEEQGYGAATGSSIVSVPRRTVTSIASVPAGSGTRIDLSRLPGITSATTGVLLDVIARSSSANLLRVWPDGLPVPVIREVTVGPDAAGANTLLVPLGAARHLRIGSAGGAVSARVVLVGTLGSSGGRLESFPPAAIADSAGSPAGRTLGRTPVTVPLTAVNEVPARGVDSVLVQVTVHSAGAAGALRLAPGTSVRGRLPVLYFAGSGPATATVLVQAVPGGAMTLASSVPGVRVDLDTVGYVSTP